MEIPVEIGCMYAVTTDSTCTVSLPGSGKTLVTATAGQQAYFMAQSNSVIISDDNAQVTRANFKGAPLVLGQPRGGNTTALPAGYIRLDYLRNTGSEYLALPVVWGTSSGIALSYEVEYYSSYNYLSIIRYGDKSVQIGRIYSDGKTGIATTSPSVSTFVDNNGKIVASYNEREDKKIKASSLFKAQEVNVPHVPSSGVSVTPVYFFAYDASASLGVYNPSKATYSLYEVKVTQGEQLASHYVPALDPNGAPCLYDLVSGLSVGNIGSGRFVAGLSSIDALANVLLHLPYKTEAGAVLDVRVANAAPEEVERLCNLAGNLKNWQITSN